jgi:hypothetical protein
MEKKEEREKNVILRTCPETNSCLYTFRMEAGKAAAAKKERYSFSFSFISLRIDYL